MASRNYAGTVTAIAHDEWQDRSCRSFRAVLDVRTGKQWDWRWNRVAFGRKYRRSRASLIELIEQSDGEKGKLARRASGLLKSAEVILDVWSEPVRRPGRYDVDVPFKIEDAWDPARLQVVQTCLVKGHRDPLVGRPLPSDSSFKGFVDNGALSPSRLGNGWPAGHPSRPYYYRPQQLASELGSDVIRHFDSPKDVEIASETYFEAALVEIGRHPWDPDRVLRAVKFGWIEEGGVRASRRCPEPGGRPGYKDFWPVETVSDNFLEVVRLDYPAYTITR